MENFDEKMAEIIGLEERFLEAGEREDELPPQEPPTQSTGDKMTTLLRLAANSVENSFHLLKMLTSSAEKEALQSMLSADCMEKLDGFQSSLGMMVSYFDECAASEEEEDEPEKEKEEPEEPEDEEPEDDEEEGPETQQEPGEEGEEESPETKEET
jgi:hypothetical protein